MQWGKDGAALARRKFSNRSRPEIMPSKSTADALDQAMMERCIALAIQAVDVGEYPYAALICRDGEVVSEGINSARQDRDVTHHAEIVVMKQALRRLNQVSLEDCTIYTNAEPCALCSYAMREPVSGELSLAFRRRLRAASLAGIFLPTSNFRTLYPRSLRRHRRSYPASCTNRSRQHGQADFNNLGVHSGAEHFWRFHCPLTSSRSCRSSARKISGNV